MAVYKVAQDVEADDKLIGPFSFRQFIYLIIVAFAGALAWGLSQLFAPLAVIPLPVILFFGALALPLRKDQPMEIYMAAIVSFYIKPRKRLWVPDGIESLVEITAPKVVEIHRTKDLSQTEAERRLSYLADIADTGGWAIRHAATPMNMAPDGGAMVSDVFFEAQQTVDVLDDGGGVSQNIDSMINQADVRRRQEMIERIHTGAAAPQTPAVTAQAVNDAFANPQITAPTLMSDPYATQYASQFSSPAAQEVSEADRAALAFNPYPTNIHQRVIQPMSAQYRTAEPPKPQPAPSIVPNTDNTPQSTSETTILPDIINLANNPDLSIETIQREANRIQKKSMDDGEEVVISLR